VRSQFLVLQGWPHESVHRMFRVAELECCRFFQLVLDFGEVISHGRDGKGPRSSRTASHGLKLIVCDSHR
jgi:hypothetical protein